MQGTSAREGAHVISTSKRRVALLVAACYFMEMLDGTILVTAAPRLSVALHVTSAAIGLLMAAYLIVMSVVIPLGGWLDARIGSRTLFLSSIALFTVASLACGGAQNFGELLVARVVQGVGAALMVPVGRTIVLARAEKTDIMRLIGYVVWPGLLAPVVAPLLGGFIVTYASWRWLFWVNVPLGIVAVMVGAVTVESTAPRRDRTAFDHWGMVVTTFGLGSLLWAAYVAGEPSGSWRVVGGFALIGVAALAEAARHLRRRTEPYVELAVLRVRSLRDALGGVAAFVVVVGALPLLLALLFQDDFAWSPLKSGVVLAGIFVGNIAMKPATTPILTRISHKRVLLASTATVAATVVAFSLLHRTTPVGLIVALSVLSGAARSMGFSAYVTLFYADVPESLMGAATTVTATVQQLFFGVALSAAVVALRLGSSVAPMSSGPTDRYRVAFLLLAVVALVAMTLASTMERSAGHSLRASP